MNAATGLDLLGRRQFLGHAGVGLGGIALAHLLHADGKLAQAAADDWRRFARRSIRSAHTRRARRISRRGRRTCW